MSRPPEELLREAKRILAETRRDFPHYKRDLDRVQIRMSSRLTRSAGNADPRSGLVQLSVPIFCLEENASGYRNTVLHEIAHVIAGPHVPAHGRVWRDRFLEIGGNGGTIVRLEVLFTSGDQCRSFFLGFVAQCKENTVAQLHI